MLYLPSSFFQNWSWPTSNKRISPSSHAKAIRNCLSASPVCHATSPGRVALAGCWPILSISLPSAAFQARIAPAYFLPSHSRAAETRMAGLPWRAGAKVIDSTGPKCPRSRRIVCVFVSKIKIVPRSARMSSVKPPICGTTMPSCRKPASPRITPRPATANNVPSGDRASALIDPLRPGPMGTR